MSDRYKTAYDVVQEAIAISAAANNAVDVDGDQDSDEYYDDDGRELDYDYISVYANVEPVDRAQIENLATAEDIRPGAIIKICDALGSEELVRVLCAPYVRTLGNIDRQVTWFDVQNERFDHPIYQSMVDSGILPEFGDTFHQFHYTVLVTPAP